MYETLMEINGIVSKKPNDVDVLSAKIDAILNYLGVTMKQTGELEFKIESENEHGNFRCNK